MAPDKTTSSRSDAARRAWLTRRTAVYRARRTARASQDALRQWAKESGWYVVFLDAPSGNPRTGIVDALLLRVQTDDADELEVRLLQLKGGSAGLTAGERQRLVAACSKLRVLPAYGFFGGGGLEVDLPPAAADAHRKK